MKKLLDLMGGEQGIELFLQQFYLEILNDDDLSLYFRGTPVHEIIKHHRGMIIEALGGEQKYSGRDLSKAHKHLVDEMNLSDKHVDIMKQKALITLQRCGFNADVIRIIDEYFESRRDVVLNRKK